MEGNDLNDVEKHVLSRITSIMPILEEGNLWPYLGFFLNVSDMANQMFVYLPQEQGKKIEEL